MPAWNPQANDIFLAALEIASPHERSAYLDQACHGQTDLRAQVQALLAASDKAGSFLEAPPSAVIDPRPTTAGTAAMPMNGRPAGSIFTMRRLPEKRRGRGSLPWPRTGRETSPDRLRRHSQQALDTVLQCKLALFEFGFFVLLLIGQVGLKCQVANSFVQFVMLRDQLL